jgi:hypothetical protein
MIRCAAAVAVVLVVNPASLSAQTVFTVSTASANVHKSPSTGSPIIGKAPRGTVLDVSRELGSWVKVVWPPAQDGVGYVHVTTGSIARGATVVAARPSPGVASRSAADGAPPPAPAARSEQARPVAPPPQAAARAQYVRPPSHSLGVGGLVDGPAFGFGATARAWSRERVGVQLELSRYALVDAPGRMTSIEIAPSLLYALPDRVTDYLWVRPYVGAGPRLQRQTLNAGPLPLDGASDNRFGFRAFGGGEVTFASAPQFALSADVGYRWLSSSFAGFDTGGVGLIVSGHWYIR